MLVIHDTFAVFNRSLALHNSIKLLCSILCLLASFSVTANTATNKETTAQTQFHFADAEKQRRFMELKAELRCPMCQNQNISDSNAMIAVDLKRKVYDLVDEGKTKQEVIDYMKARYGDFVHYQPPVTFVTIWLWAFPILFVVMAALTIFWRRNKGVDDSPQLAQQSQSSPAQSVDEKADNLMDKYK